MTSALPPLLLGGDRVQRVLEARHRTPRVSSAWALLSSTPNQRPSCRSAPPRPRSLSPPTPPHSLYPPQWFSSKRYSTHQLCLHVSLLGGSQFTTIYSVLLTVQSLSHVHLCDPTDCSTPGLPVRHHLPELAQTHVHRVSDAIQPSHPLLSPSPPAFNLSQHQGFSFQRVGSSHQVAKVLELQHQSFQLIFRVDFLISISTIIYITLSLDNFFFPAAARGMWDPCSLTRD